MGRGRDAQAAQWRKPTGWGRARLKIRDAGWGGTKKRVNRLILLMCGWSANGGTKDDPGRLQLILRNDFAPNDLLESLRVRQTFIEKTWILFLYLPYRISMD